MRFALASIALSQALSTSKAWDETSLSPRKNRLRPSIHRLQDASEPEQRRPNYDRTKDRTSDPSKEMYSTEAPTTSTLRNVDPSSDSPRPCNPSINDLFYANEANSEADVGILNCPSHQYCLPSSESSLGGFCQDFDNVLYGNENGNRRLFYVSQPSAICGDDNSNYADMDCDCSNWDSDLEQGSVLCTIYEDSCFEMKEGTIHCGSLTMELTTNANGEESTQYCYDLKTPLEASLCYTYHTAPAAGCSISVGGVECNHCQVVDGIENPEYGFISYGCYEFDCTNTLAGNQGTDCLGTYITSGISNSLQSPPTSVSTSGPTTSPTRQPSSLLPWEGVEGMTTPLPTSKPTTSVPVSTSPTMLPTQHPTARPTTYPTFRPTVEPTHSPSRSPTLLPSVTPTYEPTPKPTTVAPSTTPTQQTSAPSSTPSVQASISPTVSPTANSASKVPTWSSAEPSATPIANRIETFAPGGAAIPVPVPTPIPTDSMNSTLVPTTSPSPSFIAMESTEPSATMVPNNTDTPTYEETPEDTSNAANTPYRSVSFGLGSCLLSFWLALPIIITVV